MIPLIDLAARHQFCSDDVEKAVLAVLRSGQWIGGPVVAELEQQISTLMNRRHAVGVANGTDALELSLQVLGVGPGDEVIAPAVSFFATVGAIRRVGATPVLVDVRPDLPLIDWVQVEKARSKRTRAVIPVHLFGMDAGACETDLFVIDDVAQAVGSIPPRGRGQLAAMSFYPTKVLSSAGDGGMVATDDPELARLIRALGNHGVMDGKYHEVRGHVGGNSRLDAIHAATLLAHLPQFSARMSRRQEIYRRYRAELGPIVLEHDSGSSVSILCVRHPRREAIREHLHQRGISTGCYYPAPLSQHPAMAGARRVGGLPESEAYCAEAFAIPCHAGLTDEQVEQILTALRDFD